MRRYIILILLLVSSNAYADCTSGGVTYAEGKRVGPYVCENGQWVRK